MAKQSNLNRIIIQKHIHRRSHRCDTQPSAHQQHHDESLSTPQYSNPGANLRWKALDRDRPSATGEIDQPLSSLQDNWHC